MPLARPPRLRPGATIGVVAPSGVVDPERLAAGREYLESLGYRVKIAPNVMARNGFAAGPREERLRGLLDFHFDRSIDALILARGGAGALQLLDGIPWNEVVASPKIWMGFSDFATIGAAALAEGMVTFHGPMVASDFWHRLEPDSLDEWEPVLRGEGYPRRWSFSADQVWRSGEGAGELLAGCLTPLTTLFGTRWEPSAEGAVLFWEETDEPPWRLARLLTTWRLAGKLKSLAGMAIGALTRCAGNGGATTGELRETLLEAIGPGSFPIIVGLPFGHDGPNRAMAIGGRVRIDSFRGEIVFEEPGVD